eukprot:5751189-Pyramimonas_sp.AAC.1
MRLHVDGQKHIINTRPRAVHAVVGRDDLSASCIICRHLMRFKNYAKGFTCTSAEALLRWGLHDLRLDRPPPTVTPMPSLASQYITGVVRTGKDANTARSHAQRSLT